MTRERWFLLLAPTLAFAALIIARINALALPMFAKGPMILIGWFTLVFLVAGVILASLHRAHASKGTEALKLLIVAGLILIGLDIAIEGETLMTHLVWSAGWAGRVGRVTALLVIALLLFGMLWIMRRAVPNLVFLFAATFFAATVVNAVQSPHYQRLVTAPINNAASTGSPPVIYLIMDEMMGIEGMAQATAGGEATAAKVRGALLSRGFRVYGKAFSRYSISAMSIGSAINFKLNEDRPPELVKDFVKEFTANSKLFTQSANHGMSINVFNGFPLQVYNYCLFKHVTTCHSFETTIYYDYHWIYPEFRNSYFNRYVEGILNIIVPERNVATIQAPTNIIGFRKWMEYISNVIIDQGRDNLHFIHVYLPHSPHLAKRRLYSSQYCWRTENSWPLSIISNA